MVLPFSGYTSSLSPCQEYDQQPFNALKQLAAGPSNRYFLSFDKGSTLFLFFNKTKDSLADFKASD